MSTTKTTICLFLSLLILPQAFAELKKITLKDGSVIWGELISYDNGVYTVKNDNLGQLTLPEANVFSVVNEAPPPANQQAPQPATSTAPQTPQAQGDVVGAANTGNAFSSQVKTMQNQMMANPETMQAVQSMSADPEISAMMADPAFLQELTSAMTSNNPEAIANNPKVKQLLSNPKMQALIQQMGGAASGQ
jgi:hypothetical protein